MYGVSQATSLIIVGLISSLILRLRCNFFLKGEYVAAADTTVTMDALQKEVVDSEYERDA